MAIYTQDYAALPGSADAAAHHARTIAGEHATRRQADAEQVVRDMIAIGLASTGAGGSLNLITTAEYGRVKFELYYPDDVEDAVVPPDAHRRVSRTADAYGEDGTRSGRMIYAVLRTTGTAA